MEGKNRLGTVEIDGSEITKLLYVWFLLVKFDCYINVEICSTIKAVKYLYKYIYKGHDRVAFNINYQEDSDNIDEIKNFQAAQWILLYICYASMWVGYFISFGLLSYKVIFLFLLQNIILEIKLTNNINHYLMTHVLIFKASSIQQLHNA